MALVGMAISRFKFEREILQKGVRRIAGAEGDVLASPSQDGTFHL